MIMLISCQPPGIGFEVNNEHEEISGAEGDSRGNLTRGVEHLMTAMRELLNTMTYRGDIEGSENGRDNEEEEWADQHNWGIMWNN